MEERQERDDSVVEQGHIIDDDDDDEDSETDTPISGCPRETSKTPSL